MSNSDKGFVAYEYKTVSLRRDFEPLYLDAYKSFGWEIADNRGGGVISLEGVILKLKRDRQIQNRSEVNALQRRFEQAMETIEKLERSKSTKAFSVAITVGLLGTAFMAGATFSFLGGLIFLCVILGLIGFVGWGLGYYFYRSVGKSQALKVEPQIDQQYEKIAELCKQASELLA